jgi:hypothetical protein
LAKSVTVCRPVVTAVIKKADRGEGQLIFYE